MSNGTGNLNYKSSRTDRPQVMLGNSEFDYDEGGERSFGTAWAAYGLDDTKDGLNSLESPASSIDVDDIDINTENIDTQTELPIDFNSLFEIDSNFGVSSDDECEGDEKEESEDESIVESELKDTDDPNGRNIRQIINLEISKRFEKLEIPETVKEEQDEVAFHQFLNNLQKELGLFCLFSAEKCVS